MRRALGRYWRVQLVSCLAFTVARFSIQPGGPVTSLVFAIVITVVFLLVSLTIAIYGERADKRERDR